APPAADGRTRLSRTGSSATLGRSDPDRDEHLSEADPETRTPQHDPDVVPWKARSRAAEEERDELQGRRCRRRGLTRAGCPLGERRRTLAILRARGISCRRCTEACVRWSDLGFKLLVQRRAENLGKGAAARPPRRSGRRGGSLAVPA